MNKIRMFITAACAFIAAAGLAPAADLTINSAVTFASLDGSASDDDGTVDGCLSVIGNLTMMADGIINANDPATPTGNSASNICIDVTGNIDMQAGSAMFAENRVGTGNGGSITILVASNLTMGATNGPNAGARISNSKLTGTSSGSASNIVIDVGGSIEMGIDARINSDVFAHAAGKGGNVLLLADQSITLRGNTTDGAEITADHRAGSCSGLGSGGNITLDAGVDVVTEDGSKITVNARCSAGEIIIRAGNEANIDGLVESASTLSGTGAGRPGGGPITIYAPCSLFVSDTGKISSRGQDPGADLVHLESDCDVTIFGLVESTGVGHAIPDSPPNHLNHTNRPDKAASSTAGVEVWSGGTILIDSTGEHNGEVDADLCCGGGTTGSSWIDILANGDITIIGDTVAPFAVHANGNAGNSDDGGIVTVKSKTGEVIASALALQAEGALIGGEIKVEASGNIGLDTATLSAHGRTSGANPAKGGHIGSNTVAGIKSYNGTVTWQNGVGDVRPTGSQGTLSAASRGEIVYQDCTAGNINTNGTSFPHNGAPATTPSELADACGGMPTFQPYVQLQDCRDCDPPPPDECKWCTKSAVLSQVIQNLGECCATPDIIVDLRGFDDAAHDGDCVTVDPAKVGTDNPATCSIQAAVDYLMANGDPNGDGQLFVGVTSQDCDTGIVGSGPCLGIAGRGPNGGGMENVVIENIRPERLNVFGCSVNLMAADPNLPVITIQNSNGKVTVLDIHVKGSDLAGYFIKDNADLVIVKNARAMDNAIGYLIMDDKVEITGSPEISGNGTGVVAMGNKIIFRTNKVFENDGVGLDVQGNENVVRGGLIEKNGSHGLLVAGNDNEIKDLDVYLNSGDGICVTGNNNGIESNDVGEKNKGNTGAGVKVSGNGNTLDGLGVFGNGGDGIAVTGDSNVVKRSDCGDKDKGNGGDGIRVAGAGNQILENDLYANAGDGVEVSGGTAVSPNHIKKNRAGDKSPKNNGGNGIWVHDDTGNGTADPNEIEENTAKGNVLAGIKVSGTGHELKKNVSGGSGAADNNGDCEFEVDAGNFNGKDNKSNNVTVLPNTDGAAFPAGCLGSP